MGSLHRAGAAGALVGYFAVSCGGGARESPSSATEQQGLTGTAFGEAFVGRDTLLIHPQTWKSADAGSAAILISDTPGLCAQITSRKITAPGRLAIISLEETGSDGKVIDLDVGRFITRGEGTPSSRYGEMFLSAVDAQCSFNKLFSDQSSIQLTAVGPKSSPVSVSVDVHFASGDTLQGTVSASAICDEAAVDEFLNGNPKCD